MAGLRKRDRLQRGASDIVSVAKALMGTAAAGSGQERPGDGVSPGACPADQITPEPPEERLPHRPPGAGTAH